MSNYATASVMMAMLILSIASKMIAGSPSCPDMCKNIKVQYPFGLADGCGASQFQNTVHCTADGLQFTGASSANGYTVTQIDYLNNALVISASFMSTCHSSNKSTSFNLNPSGPFHFNGSSVLLLDCPLQVDGLKSCSLLDSVSVSVGAQVTACVEYGLQCLSALNTTDYCCMYTPTRGENSINPYYNESCGIYTGIQDYQDGLSYSKWKTGVELGWEDPQDLSLCRTCNTSGGLCGYQSTGLESSFLCYCGNNTSPKGFCGDRDHKSSNSTAIISGVVAGTVALVALVALITMCRWRRWKLKSGSQNEQYDMNAFATIWTTGSTDSGGTHLYSYKELEHATKDFSESRKLGGGGFGTVYKGKLEDGLLIAVKKLNQGGNQGFRQFHNEVTVLSKVRHENLVQLLGFCMEYHNALLVYEFVPNGSLAQHLHGESAGTLTWETRLTVAIETAEALSYLHCVEPPIFHRDVKTTNILLDKDYKVKVADFGLSRLVPSTEMTHISTAPQGTPGYLDPDYHQSYHLSDKSDVYSFGVVLMELLTAKIAVDMAREKREINLASLAVAKIQAGALDDIVDPHLEVGCKPIVKDMVNQVAELHLDVLLRRKKTDPR